MKYLNQEIENELKNQGAELIRFVGISHLDEKQNRQLPTAIVFALPLTAEYAKMVFNIPDYVQVRIITISTMMNIRKPNIRREK